MTNSGVPLQIIGRPSSEIVLGSASHTRRRLLEQSGVPHVVRPSRVDEEELKLGLRAEGAAPVEIAEVLAEAKAKYVSRKMADKMVLGADQILTLGQETLDKPQNRDVALGQLLRLRGRQHELISYAVIVRGGQRIWHAFDKAVLTIRADASDEFLNAYLDAAGSGAFCSPGAYRVESLGVQLFSNIDGSHYTILGLPLLKLLAYLRENRILET